ncbi:MAG: hypothetical protein Q8O99_01700 [bacterium]|nr:hypothetical protein [bacterium]
MKVLEQSTIVNKSEEIDQQIATLGDTIATLTTEAKNLETTFNDEENRI